MPITSTAFEFIASLSIATIFLMQDLLILSKVVNVS